MVSLIRHLICIIITVLAIYGCEKPTQQSINRSKPKIPIQKKLSTVTHKYEKAIDEKHKETNMRLKFSTIDYCNDSDWSKDTEDIRDMCIYDNDNEIPLELPVTLLKSSGDPPCLVVPVEKYEINTTGASGLGKRVKDINCGKIESDTAVVFEEVDDYKALLLPPLEDPALVYEFTEKIKNSGLLNKFIENDTIDILLKPPTIYRYTYPDAEVYFISYDPRPFIMMFNESYRLISDKGCTSVKGAFRLNGRYYIRVFQCECHTDSCGDDFIEI